MTRPMAGVTLTLKGRAKRRQEKLKEELTDAPLILTKPPRPKPYPGEAYNKFVERVFEENGKRFKRHEVRNTDGSRPVSFEDACRKHPHRFTLDHIPAWADKPIEQEDGSIKYAAPHYASDKEWYENTEFLGEGTTAVTKYCRSMNRSYPLGKWLDKPYSQMKGKVVRRKRMTRTMPKLERKVAPKPKTTVRKTTRK